jgi:hypothetical protein
VRDCCGLRQILARCRGTPSDVDRREIPSLALTARGRRSFL